MYKPQDMFCDYDEEDEYSDRLYGEFACLTCDESGKCAHCDGDCQVYYACVCGCGDEIEQDCARCDGSGDCSDCDGAGHDGGYVDPKRAMYERWRLWTGQLHPNDIRTVQEALRTADNFLNPHVNPDDYTLLRVPA